MDLYFTNASSVRDISSLLLDKHGRLRVVPARVLATTTAQERLVFGVRHGLYSFPTEELCAFLRAFIRGKTAIEIGAGHGALAQALSIPATDNRQQEEASVKAHYRQISQPTVPYGEHVEKLDAADAVEKYRPNVVIACWVTHLFDSNRPQAGGNVFGVDEAKLIASCDEYVFIGNEQVHAHKPIWAISHQRLEPPWLYSRAVNGSPDFIVIWRRTPVKA
jgi:hypothetical protein